MLYPLSYGNFTIKYIILVKTMLLVIQYGPTSFQILVANCHRVRRDYVHYRMNPDTCNVGATLAVARLSCVTSSLTEP
jgi:hypothetical protein